MAIHYFKVWIVCQSSANLSAKFMKTVFLHIGIHKTGTTTVQSALKRANWSKTAHVRSVSFEEANHSIPMYTIFSNNRCDYHIWKNSGKSNDYVTTMASKYLQILTDDLNDDSVSTLVISGEDMSLLETAEQEELCAFFTSRNCSVQVIALTRDPFALALSMNLERIKNGAKGFERFTANYNQRLQGFINHVGISNVRVFSYEDCAESGLIEHFSKLINVPLADQGHLNKALTREAMALILQLNELNIVPDGSLLKLLARRYFVSLIQSFFSSGSSHGSLSGLKSRALLADDVENDLAWLSGNFSIDYRLDFTHTQNDLPDSSIGPDRVEEFFDAFALEYDPDCSIQENLLRQYESFELFFKYQFVVSQLLSEQKFEDAGRAILEVIELGDARAATFQAASEIFMRTGDLDRAVLYATRAVQAKDHNHATKADSEQRLANVLQLVDRLNANPSD